MDFIDAISRYNIYMLSKFITYKIDYIHNILYQNAFEPNDNVDNINNINNIMLTMLNIYCYEL